MIDIYIKPVISITISPNKPRIMIKIKELSFILSPHGMAERKKPIIKPKLGFRT